MIDVNFIFVYTGVPAHIRPGKTVWHFLGRRVRSFEVDHVELTLAAEGVTSIRVQPHKSAQGWYSPDQCFETKSEAEVARDKET